MPVLRFKDKEYFSSLLGVFKAKRQVTFEIKETNMRISTLSPPYFYLNIPNTIYEMDEAIEFTIDVGDLLNNINSLKTDLVILDGSFRLISSYHGKSKKEDMHANFIDIPFINPIQGHYKNFTGFSTRVLVNKNALKYFPTGTVVYSNDGRLILKKYDQSHEETMIIDAEYLEEGYLDFCCQNDWVSDINIDMISTVMLCFTEGALCIKILFSKFKNVMLEIQVMEKLAIT